MVWFMDINLTDNRTTVGSYDNRSSGGVLLMPKERHMREGAPIQPHAHALQCAKPAGRFPHCYLAGLCRDRQRSRVCHRQWQALRQEPCQGPLRPYPVS